MALASQEGYHLKIGPSMPGGEHLQGQVGQVYNIGSQQERTVLDVAADICAVFRLPAGSQVEHVRDRAFNDRRYPMPPALEVCCQSVLSSLASD